MFVKYESLLLCSVICLTDQCFRVHCLPINQTTDGQYIDEQSTGNGNDSFDMNSYGAPFEWVPAIDCPNGCANFMRHINVDMIKGAPHYWIQHDAIQFDVQCPDGSDSKYTVEFGQISGQTIVRRRFGYYKDTTRVYKDAKIQFNITELAELTQTNRNYSLDTFNSQVYVRQTFVKVLYQMCAKLGFYSTVDGQDIYYDSDGPEVMTEHLCPNNLFAFHLDRSLLFSKYSLIILLLIIGTLILLINLYLKYENNVNTSDPDDNDCEPAQAYDLLVDDNGNHNEKIDGQIGKSCQQYRDHNERRKGVITYNTFEITKY